MFHIWKCIFGKSQTNAVWSRILHICIDANALKTHLKKKKQWKKSNIWVANFACGEKMINIMKNKKSPPLQFTLQLHNMAEKSPLTFPSFRQFFSPRWLALALILRAQACHHHFSSIHQFLLEPPISSNSKWRKLLEYYFSLNWKYLKKPSSKSIRTHRFMVLRGHPFILQSE